jgi:predicted AlkP superfamily pyrophosphatase or phosphodiesterase
VGAPLYGKAPVLLLLLACSHSGGVADVLELPALGASEPPTLILASVDGLRWDYPGRASTPTLDRLATEGAHAEALVPAFPSKTFPNHYSIVTGLYPEHHGIVDNTFYDPERGAWFSMSDDDAVRDGSWWGGEPIWATAERQGLTTATCFWPGSEAEIAGERPTYALAYDGGMTWEERVDTVLYWLELPEEERPQFITVYFEEPDHAGHSYGPDGAEVEEATAAVDEALGWLVDGLEVGGWLEKADLLVVSDHGMTGTGPDRLVYLDDYIDVYDEVEVTSWGPVAQLWTDDADGVAQRLSEVRDATCARKQDLPEALHFSESARIAEVVCVADDGYSITTRDWAESNPDWYDGGTHGYAPTDPAMQGIFYARGPHIAEGYAARPFLNTDIYSLMAHILGVEPAATDGDLANIDELLRAR